MRVILFHNPGAGDEGPSRKTLLALLADAGYAAEYQSTKVKGWKKALAIPPDLAVVAGGDGTVAKVARAIAGFGSPMAILPVGTVNNIARTLGLDGEPEDLIARWRRAVPRPLDLGITMGPWGERYFVEACGVGLFANFLATSERPEVRKRIERGDAEEQMTRGVEALLTELADCRPARWTVVIDGRDFSGEYLLVEAMNIRSIGPRLELAPEADPGDGLLDVALLPAADRDGFADYLRRRLAGTAAPPRLIIQRGRQVRLTGPIASLHVDDESVPRAAGKGKGKDADGETTPLSMDIWAEPGAVEVLV